MCPPPGPGLIYYARVNGYIKIGWTSQTITERMDKYPPGTELLAMHPGSRRVEAAIHERLTDHLAAKAEWYAEAPEVMALVEETRRQYGEPPGLPAPAPPVGVLVSGQHRPPWTGAQCTAGTRWGCGGGRMG